MIFKINFRLNTVEYGTKENELENEIKSERVGK